MARKAISRIPTKILEERDLLKNNIITTNITGITTGAIISHAAHEVPIAADWILQGVYYVRSL